MFADREQAGLLLARALTKYQNESSVIFALPRGGVAVGSEIAHCLKLPLEIVVSRKIGHPFNPEYAIAAVSESGFLAENEKETEHIDERWFERAIEVETEEARRRRKMYSEKGLPKSLKGKTAIIVDDGLATGLTLKAAIKEIRSLEPKTIVVAVPVAPFDTVDELKKLADEIVVINSDKKFIGSVGSYYQDFPQLSDADVIDLLKSHNG